MKMLLPCLYAFLGCAAFSVIFEEKRLRIILSCSATGFVAWLTYLLFGFLGTSIRMQTVRYFLAAVVVALLSEMFARIHKSPATLFLTIGIIPLVPGAGIYYTMEALLNGSLSLFARRGLETAACAGAIAVGCSLVSSVFRMCSAARKRSALREE